jgi:hypothetical protein
MQQIFDLFFSGHGAANKPHSTGGSSSTTPKISVQDSVLSEAQIPNHTHDGVTEIEDNDNMYMMLEQNHNTLSQQIKTMSIIPLAIFIFVETIGGIVQHVNIDIQSKQVEKINLILMLQHHLKLL